MSKRPLPEYRLPPVIEVVCGVQFAPIPGFLSVHFGEFWQRVKEAYPKAEDRPPLVDVREDDQGTAAPTEFLELPPLRRAFYADTTGNSLLQLQPSRFLSNWRRERPEDSYPRYTTAMSRFLEGWRTFVSFASETGLGQPKANQYELTYINHIVEHSAPYPAGMESFLPMFAWSAAQSCGFLSPPEAANFRLQFGLPDGMGRLHVTLSHGRRKTDGKGVLILDLTARGPARSDGSDMDAWFTIAHEWIVRGFTDLTSAAAHQAWGREK
jgi:uncharacterized protein (TIGR04255 family)